MLMKGLKNFIQFTDFDQIIDLVAGRGRGGQGRATKKKITFFEARKHIPTKNGVTKLEWRALAAGPLKKKLFCDFPN